MTSMLEQHSISTLLEWRENKTLELELGFQRRSVWPEPARRYLIDTIITERPIPNIYLRTKTDVASRRSSREVVDGQQRIRAIESFANGEIALPLTPTGEYSGLTYAELPKDAQESFLTYEIGVVQLFNASDSEVLDIFRRINAYGLKLNPQELRHGRHMDESFRDAVVQSSRDWQPLWERGIVGPRGRVRMEDDQLMAEMYSIVLDGVKDGGQPAIKRAYENYAVHPMEQAAEKVNRACEFILTNFDDLLETGLGRAPQFLMLFAAVAHALYQIPAGGIGEYMPDVGKSNRIDMSVACYELGKLADVLDASFDVVPDRYKVFKHASAGSTHRISSRKVRFLELVRALTASE